MGGFVETAMDVVGKPINILLGGVQSAGEAVAGAGQKVLGELGRDEVVQPLMIAAAIAITYGTGSAMYATAAETAIAAGATETSIAAAAGEMTTETAAATLTSAGAAAGESGIPIWAEVAGITPETYAATATGAAATGAAAAGAAAAGAAGAAGGGIGLGTALGITAGGQLASALVGSEAARKAASMGAESADKATQAQLQMYYQSRTDLAPWREAGGKALAELEKNVMAGPGEFVPSEQPGYKFGYEELVENPLLRGASAAGKVRSGEVLKSLSDRAQDYASLSYDSWLNRWLTKMQPLQSLAGVGQTSASTTAQLGTQTGQGVAQSTLAGGQAQAAGAINQANALTGGIRAGTSTLMDALIMNKVFGGNLFGQTSAPTPTPTNYVSG